MSFPTDTGGRFCCVPERLTYDEDGNVLTRTVTDNDMGEVKTAYTYDVLGRPTAITTVTQGDGSVVSPKTLDET